VVMTGSGSTSGSIRTAHRASTRRKGKPIKQPARCFKIREAASGRQWVLTAQSSAKTRSRLETILAPFAIRSIRPGALKNQVSIKWRSNHATREEDGHDLRQHRSARGSAWEAHLS